MLKVNLGTDNRERWNVNGLAAHFMIELDDIVDKYRHWFADIDLRDEDEEEEPQHKRARSG